MSDTLPFPVECRKCSSTRLSEVREGRGLGKDLHNYGRLYRICYECNDWLPCTPPTPLEAIPEDVQVAHTIRHSRSHSSAATTIVYPCKSDGCRGTKPGTKRRGNKLCARKYCGDCCKAAGGCHLSSHRTATSPPVVLPLPGSPALSTGSVPAIPRASETPHVTSLVSAAPTIAATPTRTFARPIPSNYAKRALEPLSNQLQQTKRAENVQRLRDIVQSMVHLYAWTELNTDAIVMDVAPQQPRMLILADHKEFLEAMSMSVDTTLLVYHPYPRGEWVSLQECRDVERLLTLVDGGAGAEHSAIGVSPSRSKPYTRPSVRSPSRSPSASSSPSKDLFARTATPRFPMLYTSDMAPRFRQLATITNPSAVAALFPTLFDGCLYKQSTFYKHRAVFEKAQYLGILRRYEDFGRSPAGLWKNLVSAVKKHNDDGSSARPSHRDADLTHTHANSPHADRPNDDPFYVHQHGPSIDTDDLDFKTYDHARIEQFKMNWENGSIQSEYGVNDDNLHLTWVLRPRSSGRLYDIHFVTANIDLVTRRTYAVKRGHGEWWQSTYASKDVGTWNEAAPMFKCAEYAESFTRRASEMEVDIYGISVLPTHYMVVYGGDRLVGTFLAQPWKSGITFPTCHPVQASRAQLLQDTLAALTHYMHQATNGEIICLAFQGFLSPTSLSIFDCETHSYV
ncbi:hypothetical protein EYR38_001705 [Pleurotus pulmonarius]|nr:hypothetical protein EYR38_001705 [Pleurotus pulmonarius]